MEFLTTLGIALSVSGGCIAIIKPILKLNTTIVNLIDSIDSLRSDYSETVKKNSDSHRKIWEHNGIQDKTINDHEIRIQILEKGADYGERD